MGLRISVFRDTASQYDCTLNGVSSRYTQLTVVNVDGPAEPSDDAPAVRLERGPMGSVRLVPEEAGDSWTMFGGNYGSTCDSRFSRAIESLLGHRFYGAVAIHDRVEE